MIEDTLREIVRNKIIKILGTRISRDVAEEIERKMTHEERGRILKEYERNGSLSEETFNSILSKYYYRDLTSVLFGIPSNIEVYPEITKSLIGSGKSGIKGLKKHVRELGFSDDKFEEILQAIYSEISKRSSDSRYLQLLAIASLEIGAFYIEYDYRKAEEFLVEAYELRSQISDVEKLKRLLDYFVRLSTFYCKVKKIEKAKNLYEKANNVLKELNIDKVDTSTLNSLEELRKRLCEF